MGSYRVERWILVGLLCGHLLLTLAYSAANPLGEAPDEADHWAYVVYLAQEHSLPVGPQITQSKHPPFYHASAAFIAAIVTTPSFDFLRANPDLRVPTPADGPFNFFIHTALENWPWQDGPLAFRLARLWSILLSLGTIIAAYGLMHSAFPKESELALTVAGVLAFLPSFAFIGSAVSNDGAAAFFSTVALWGGFTIYRNRSSMRAGWWTSLALGLGLLTKVSVLAVWPSVAFLIVGARYIVPLRVWLRNLLAIFLPAGLMAAPWFLRNWRLYGDPMGLELARQTIDQRLAPWTWADSWWLVKGWFFSFWGRFGAIGQIAQPVWMDWLLLALTVVAGAGLVQRLRQEKREDFRFGVAVLVLAVVSIVLVMWRYSLIALGTDQGRLLYPALGPIVGLWVMGLMAWMHSSQPDKRADEEVRTGRAIDLAHMTGLLLVGATALWSIAILIGVITPAYSPDAILVRQTPAASANSIDFGEIQLVAAEFEPSPILYWTATETPSQDWRTVLRITAEDGTLLWEWQRSPGQGRLATDRWPAGVQVRDSYDIRWPDWVGEGRYRVEVGLRRFDGTWALPVHEDRPTANAEHPFVEVGWIEYQP